MAQEDDSVFRKGVSVNIKRSNGRVHAAVISGYDADTRTVTVEWNEQGETKGKTIDVDVITQLNPSLLVAPNKAQHAETAPPVQTFSMNNTNYGGGPSDAVSTSGVGDAVVAAASSKSGVAAGAQRQSHNNIVDQTMHDGRHQHELAASAAMPPPPVPGAAAAVGRPTVVGGKKRPIPANAAASTASATNEARRETRALSQVTDPSAGRRSVAPASQRTHTTAAAAAAAAGSKLATSVAEMSFAGAATAAGAPGGAGRRSTVARGSMLPQNVGLNANAATSSSAATITAPGTTSGAAAAAAASGSTSGGGTGKYTSTVVSEIQKMEKNRAERRARMDQAREERQTLMNMDPGNPNWQYLGMIRDFRAEQHINTLQFTDRVKTFQINVCLRKRPLNKKEIARKDLDVITVTTRDTLFVHEPRQKVDLTKYLENQPFRFDYVFDDDSNNEMVYKFTAQPLIDTIFEGGFATCFAYGQTGSGKTHTMGGEFVGTGATQDSSRGIYAFVAQDVFRLMAKPKYKKANLLVKCSFFEIYSGKLFDLLNKKARLKVMEDGAKEVNVIGIVEKAVHTVDDVLEVIQSGNKVRTSGQTSANQHSSRSHAVFQVLLRRRDNDRLHGKFSLIDLAGNERGADTMSSNRTTRMEGGEINKSLLALKECIRALGRKNAAHLPFRGSKLTQVLRDSFIGQNSKTCMIAMISPGMSCCEHTLNTLRYANRVKELVYADDDNHRDHDAADAVAAQHQVSSTSLLSTGSNGGGVAGADDSLNSSNTVMAMSAECSGDAGSLRNSIENLSAQLDSVGNGHASGAKGKTGAGGGDGNAAIDDVMLPDEPSDGMDDDNNNNNNNMNMNNNNDQETDLSPEMISFNETLSRLNEVEEDVQEEHKGLLDKLNVLQKELRHAYAVTNEVDYDIDGYVNEMEKSLDQLITASARMKDKVVNFRAHLRAEEEMSRKIYSNSSAATYADKQQQQQPSKK